MSEIPGKKKETHMHPENGYGDISHIWEALRKNENTYRELFEKAGDAIFFLEAEGPHTGRIIDANLCAAKMHGYTRNEIIGKNIRELDGPIDAKKAQQRIQEMKAGKWIREKGLHRKKDGTIFPVEISAGIIILNNVPYILAFDRDISKEEKAKSNLKEQLTFFQTLIDTIPSPVFYKDEAGRYLGCNTSFETFIGISKKDLLGKTVFDVAPKDMAQIYKDADDELLRARGTQIYEAQVKYADESIHDIIFNKAVFSKPDGDVGGMVGVMLDITESKATENERQELRKRLYQAQKMEAIGNLSAGIAHDFNNILSGILGASQLLSLYSDQSPKLKKEIDKIIKGTQRAGELVHQILSFSKQTEIKKVPLTLAGIVREALKLIRSSMPSFIEIDIQILSKAKILADPARIHQLVMNLSTNAGHAMTQKGGILTVVVREMDETDETKSLEPDLIPGQFLVLEISDTGCGIPQENIDRIFEPYFSLKTDTQGTGLGLSIVHAVVEEHKGRIKVSSQEGKGSLFRVYLPKIQTMPSTGEKPQDPLNLPKTTGTERIMIVDDEESILSSTQGYLQDCGYQVLCFSDGNTALEAFKKDPDQIDLVITDLTMPVMLGNDLAKQIKAARPELPVILCSGRQQKQTDTGTDNSHISQFFQKPVDLHLLVQSIRDLLDKG